MLGTELVKYCWSYSMCFNVPMIFPESRFSAGDLNDKARLMPDMGCWYAFKDYTKTFPSG